MPLARMALMAMVGWMMLGLPGSAALGEGGQGQGQGQRAAKPRTDSLIGTPVTLGPFQGELSVWETGLELVVYDGDGKVVPPRQIAARAEITRFNGTAKKRAAVFTSKDGHSWAPVDLTGAADLELRIEATIRGARHAGTVVWRLAEDRGRRNDGLTL